MIKITNESNTKPKIIQADNGSEFKGEFSDWTHNNNIDLISYKQYANKHQVHAQEYSLIAEAMIEKYNYEFSVKVIS